MTRYESGRLAEYWARNELREQGYFVIRSAGSKGPVDLVAIGPTEVRLIQVKRVQGSVVPSFHDELVTLHEMIVPQCVTREMWVFVEGRKAWVILPA